MEQTKLTAEISAKYWGCKIQTKKGLTGILCAIFGIKNSCNIKLQDGSISVGHLLSECKLILKDLGNISEGDAVEVGQTANISHATRQEHFGCDYSNYITIGRDICHSIEYNLSDRLCISLDDMIKVLDFLRSKSYNIDNLPESVWVNEKTINQPVQNG
jgi:hypothetical protein